MRQRSLPPEARIRWARAIRSRSFLDSATPLAARFADAGERAGLGADGLRLLFESDAVPELLPADLRRKDSIYWVLSTRCNNGHAEVGDDGAVRFRTCGHCLNGSGPRGVSMTVQEIEQVVERLPDRLREVEFSGGEPLHPDVFPLTLHALRLCAARYGSEALLSVQTNGDFLRSQRNAREMLAALGEAGMRRLVIASVDVYHGRGDAVDERVEERKRLRARVAANLQPENAAFVGAKDFGRMPNAGAISVHFFGADVENRFDGFFVDALAPNARAVRMGLVSVHDSRARYCERHAGARGFLGSDADDQVAVNGGPVTPCCWFTEFPLGDAREQTIPEMLHAYVTDPLALAQHLGKPDAAAEIAAFVSPALGNAVREIVGDNGNWNECIACRRITVEYAGILRRAGYARYESLWQDIPTPWNHRTDPEYDIAFLSWERRRNDPTRDGFRS